ncbi:MAG TPA: dephospho-CoA kinase [Candidatus Dormibacteraeota bacterium]|nr:dephospho-CoA kinase [Candidatus Dormibacteraeota bacterium]
MTVRIGLTGPIGCGKSTVAGWLGDRGAIVIDADELAREVTDLPDVREAIFARFGDEVRRPDGTLDRAALAGRVFEDPAELAALEGLTHSEVRRRILARLAEAESGGAAAVVIEAIKLVEGGLADACQEVWVVTCTPAEQRERLAGRGVPTADAERRIAAQGDRFSRLRPVTGRIISASGTPAEVEARVERAFRAALERHDEGGAGT